MLPASRQKIQKIGGRRYTTWLMANWFDENACHFSMSNTRTGTFFEMFLSKHQRPSEQTNRNVWQFFALTFNHLFN
jgi:hypothetical protein